MMKLPDSWGEVMKIKTTHGNSGMSIIFRGNPPNIRIFAELTETELVFLQNHRNEIESIAKRAEAEKELKRAKILLDEVRAHNARIKKP